MSAEDILKDNNIPDWARWLAQDFDGSWWVYEVEPLQQHSGWYENEVGQRQAIIKTDTNPDWKSSLTRINR